MHSGTVISTPETGTQRTENPIHIRRSKDMNANIARYIALPVVSAGILGGAALGLAGMASAATTVTETSTGSAIVATPDIHARPAPIFVPGWHHHGGGHIYLGTR
jgi:hypothetical protein